MKETQIKMGNDNKIDSGRHIITASLVSDSTSTQSLVRRFHVKHGCRNITSAESERPRGNELARKKLVNTESAAGAALFCTRAILIQRKYKRRRPSIERRQMWVE